MVVETYQRLATSVHRMLHVNLRLTVMHCLAGTISESYCVDSTLSDPDPAIQALTVALTAYDAEVLTYLPTKQYTQIIDGLSSLTDTYLLHVCISRIRSMNEDGCKLMQLNVLVLQQNLKNIESSADFTSSALFFELFEAGPEAIMQRAREYKKGFGVSNGLFTMQAVKDLLKLCYNERLNSERREVGVQAQRQLDAQMLDLDDYMY